MEIFIWIGWKVSFLSESLVSDRYPEIDLFRGLAIVMMIIYHLLFDLYFFGIYQADVLHGFWRFFGMGCASLFLFIVGLSFSISYSRASKKIGGFPLYLKYLKRGLFIISCGFLVTAATWIFLQGEGFVVFGILQCIGVSVIIAPFFYRFGWKNIIIGLIVIVLGLLLAGIYGPVSLLPFGIRPEQFSSIDYVPLAPWFGLVLFGIGAGSLLYPGGIRFFAKKLSIQRPFLWICFMGRHSLLIYLLHQPVMILILMLFFPENIVIFTGMTH